MLSLIKSPLGMSQSEPQVHEKVCHTHGFNGHSPKGDTIIFRTLVTVFPYFAICATMMANNSQESQTNDKLRFALFIPDVSDV